MLSLQGRLDSEAAPDFEQQCSRETRGETQTLVLNLSDLDYLSSAGLRAILATGKAQSTRGGKLILCVAPGPARQIIEASGFHKIFPVCASMAETGKHTSGGFKVHLHKEWGVDVMTVYGRVDAELAPEVEAAGRKILDAPYQKLLINLSAVEYLSSAGLCALLNLGKLATAKQGRLSHRLADDGTVSRAGPCGWPRPRHRRCAECRALRRLQQPRLPRDAELRPAGEHARGIVRAQQRTGATQPLLHRVHGHGAGGRTRDRSRSRLLAATGAGLRHLLWKF